MEQQFTLKGIRPATNFDKTPKTRTTKAGKTYPVYTVTVEENQKYYDLVGFDPLADMLNSVQPGIKFNAMEVPFEASNGKTYWSLKTEKKEDRAVEKAEAGLRKEFEELKKKVDFLETEVHGLKLKTMSEGEKNLHKVFNETPSF